jgi:GTPase SAR1 family protein
MIGQDYFDVRSRLGTALFSLRALVADAGGDPDQSTILENLVNSLRDPFVFVIAGEVNVGKSTFLNALFGAEFSRTGVIPTTDKVLFFKHGPTVRHVPVSRTLEEVYVPADFLKDFHVVDTPGTNSVEYEHQEITERFIPSADLVIFVFSAMNPWGASAWQFLDKVHRHWLRHVVFVLQQCDLRSPEEIDAILQYMRQLCKQRYEREFPIYPVSAKMAYLARSSGLDRERLMAASGFEPLEKHISRTMGASGARIGKLDNALRIAQDILTSLREKGSGKASTRDDKSRALHNMEETLESQQLRTVQKLHPAIEATDSEISRVASLLLSHLGNILTPRQALQSLFRESRTVKGCDETLLSEVREPALSRWEQACTILEDDIGHAASYLTQAMRHELKVQMRQDLQPDADYWRSQQRRFLNRVKEMLSTNLNTLGLESLITPALRRSRQRAWGQVLCVVLGLAGGVAALVSGHLIPALSSFMIGGVLSLILWYAEGRHLGGVRTQVEQKLTTARELLSKQMKGYTREEVSQQYDAFTRILLPAKEKLSDQERRHGLLRDQISDLTGNVQKLEAELRALGNAKS